MISFHNRTDQDELMDDFSITDHTLTDALEQLRTVNQFLGGYATTMSVLAPWLRSQSSRSVRILDLGTGIGDFPEYIVRWVHQRHLPIGLEVVGIDANPFTVSYAQQALERRLPPELRPQIKLEVADALDLPYSEGSFDVVICAMFLHHFSEDRAVRIVRSMARVAKWGILINDLHRHPLAYYGIYSLSRLFRASPMVQHDGPISVLRGFRRGELAQIAQKAALTDPKISWHFPFRWCLTTLKS